MHNQPPAPAGEPEGQLHDITLPLPSELRRLLTEQSAIQLSLAQNSDLLSRLQSLLEARKNGHNRMDLPVDVGMGFLMEGVVQDTSKIYLKALDETYVEMEVDKAEDLVKRKISIQQKQLGDNAEPIEKLKRDYALVTKTLQKALGGDGDPEP